MLNPGLQCSTACTPAPQSTLEIKVTVIRLTVVQASEPATGGWACVLRSVGPEVG